jgi:hypothetical protein
MNKTTHLSDAPPLMAFYNAEYNFSLICLLNVPDAISPFVSYIFSIQNRPSLWEKEEIVLPPSKTYSEEGENEVTTE